MRMLVLILTLLAAPAVFAQSCEISIEGNDMLQFNKKEIAIGAGCTEVTLTLKHTGQLPRAQMGHNVVITSTGDFQDVAQAGIQAGLDNQYVVPGDERVLATTDVIGGGEETSVTFDVSGWDKSGDYTFFCSFPGHSAIMNGKVVFSG